MKTIATILMSLTLLTPALAGEPYKPRVIPAGYSVETIATPPKVEMAVGGIAFSPDGKKMYATTRHGDVWTYEPETAKWELFADGLHEALGIWIDKPTGDIFVGQRPEVTQLIDSKHTGKADIYRTVNGDWGYDGQYHEYCFGPVRDSKGNFYVTLNLSASPQGSVQKSIMGHPSPWRGWMIQITPEGKMVPFASGLRSPCGIGISRDDELFYTDNQGDWNAVSTLYHVEKGHFYGHPASLRDDPAFKDRDMEKVPNSEYEKLRTLPAIWIPYGELANSPGEPTFDYTGGKFGPFTGQVFIGDQTKSNVMRVALEKIDGAYQGAIFNFVDTLQSGVIRNTFGPDGSLWVGQTGRGWSSAGGKPFGVQHIIYDGKTVPFEMLAIHLTATGFKVTFTKPVDKALASKAESYAVKHWGYLYHATYGSPKVGETAAKIEAVTVAEDGMSVELKLPPLVAQQVYQVTLTNVKAADGSAASTNTGYYTLNRLLK